MSEKSKALTVLTLNTIAFAVCFACWMLNGVLITFLVDNGLYHWDKAQLGWLIGIPVLTGSIIRLPVGVLTDKYGGKIVYTCVMLVAAAGMYSVSFADSYVEFIFASLAFGIAGTAFAVGIAYTSVWFSRERQGTALGIFGAGNAGAAFTTVFAPILLKHFTDNGANLEGWRTLPQVYALGLVVMTVIFWIFTHPKKVEHGHELSLMERLEPLKYVRVWRFGLYYFFVFGGFVALAQWLVPYYVNVYTMPLATAGLLAAIFSFPSGVIRAIGGVLSDIYGARSIMYWVFGACLVACLLLIVPRMDIQSPGEGIMASRSGVVTYVSEDKIIIDTLEYTLIPKGDFFKEIDRDNDLLIWPTSTYWQEPVVKVGDKVIKKQLLAKGVTHIFFQANVWVFTGLVLILGIMTGIGKAAVYKHIPDYFPKDVGVVGGIVGVIGGLGGFFCPIIFGYLLKWTGIWTTCWMFFTVIIVICIIWMHVVVRKMIKDQDPELLRLIEAKHAQPVMDGGA